MQGDLDALGDLGQGLVDAVVDDLPDTVHEPAGVGGADVHAGSLADRFESLQHQQVCCVVRVVDDGVLSRSWCSLRIYPASDRREGRHALERRHERSNQALADIPSPFDLGWRREPDHEADTIRTSEHEVATGWSRFASD